MTFNSILLFLLGARLLSAVAMRTRITQSQRWWTVQG